MGWSESHISLTFQWQKTAKIESLMNNTVDDGMEWKSHNVDILMKKIGKNCKIYNDGVDFHSTPSKNIQWFYIFRQFFLTVMSSMYEYNILYIK